MFELCSGEVEVTNLCLLLSLCTSFSTLTTKLLGGKGVASILFKMWVTSHRINGFKEEI